MLDHDRTRQVRVLCDESTPTPKQADSVFVQLMQSDWEIFAMECVRYARAG